MNPRTADPAQSTFRRVLAVSCGLFALLVGVYVLSYSGIYHSSDEVGYVRDAVAIIREGVAELGHGGPFALILALGLVLGEIGQLVQPLQGLFLISIVLTALAAVFLFLTTVELGYDHRAGLLVALLYGLASPAWVYSKLLFRDPFVAMALMAMVACLVRFRHRGSYLWLGLGCIACVIAVATRPSTAIVTPFAFLYVAQVIFGKSNRGSFRLSVRTILVGLALLGLLIAVGYTLATVFNLYTKWLDRLLRFFEHWNAIAGLLVSPGRGVLFYAPIVLIGLAGLLRFARRHPREALLVYGPIPFYLLMVSSHPMWWGGWNWGPRYLIPVMPLLILPAVSLIEAWLVKPVFRWAIVLAVGIALWSLLTQAVGASIGTNSPTFEAMTPSTFFQWTSAPFAQLAQLDKISPDLAWLHVSGGLPSQAVVVAPSLLVVLSSAIVLWLAATRGTATAGLTAAAIVCALASLGVAVGSIHRYSKHDLRYESPAGFNLAAQRVGSEARPGDLLIYDHWKTDELDHILPSIVSNSCGAQCPPIDEVVLDYWGPSEQRLRLDEHLAWLEKIRWNYRRVWLIPSVIPSSDPNTEVQPWLDAYLFKAGCEQFSSEIKLCLYYTLTPRDELAPASATPRTRPARDSVFIPLIVTAKSPKRNPQAEGPSKRKVELDAVFGDRIRLNDVVLYWQTPTEEATGTSVRITPGEPLLAELLWQGLEPVDRRYKVSLQLLDSQGALVHQMDREPLDGSFPMTEWPVHQLLSDRYAFVLPTDLPDGTYQLILAVYDPETGARLPVGSGDFISLTDLAVENQS